MRSFIDILRFELRLHLASPLFWGVALLFFLLHLLTLTRTGINLGENEQIALNSAWLIFQTEIVLGVFGMLPAILFAVTAINRDAERHTAEFFFTTPVSRIAFVLGRFSAGTLAALAVGSIGLLGALAGSFMPWLDPQRVAPFAWQPWVASLTLLVLPNLIVFCALFFSVAALTRSTALTFGAALGVLVLEIYLNVSAVGAVPSWLLLADPFGALPVAEVARYWTVSELNTLLPTALLAPNRILWLGIASFALLLTLWRYRMELPAPRSLQRRNSTTPSKAPTPTSPVCTPRFNRAGSLRQFLSQLRMDCRGVYGSPLFWIMLAFAALSIWVEASNLRGGPSQNLPLYPATSLMLDFVRFSLMQFVLLSIIYFSAVLVHRERDNPVDGISDASPSPDWIAATSKAAALILMTTSLLAMSAAVTLVVQELADFHDHSLGVLIRGVFIYNGFYFWMLCVLAVFVQMLSPGKWSGMVVALLVFVTVMALPALGFEHLLMGFRIPHVVYSDMNGFGHYRLQTFALIGYWGAFCALLLVASRLLYPRGHGQSLRERLHDARLRFDSSSKRRSALAAIVLVGFGGFIFYNTIVLNDYTTTHDSDALLAKYEIDYGKYRDAPSPSLVDLDLRVELYPAERRLTSRGTAGLRNNKSIAIDEFVMTVDRRHRVEELTVDGATLLMSDAPLGFYLFKPTAPLAPGSSLTLHWSLGLENKGFPNSNADNTIVGNGSYQRNGHVPRPGYCIDCELEQGRARFGLPPVQRLPALGDPAHLDDVWPGLNSRSSFRIVIGTDSDQTAVSAGTLKRTWEENGRRYFEYAHGGPVWPFVTLQSASFAIARDRWNDVAIEVYHDPKHAWSVQAMLDTAKKGLTYYTREFAPYHLPYYRMAEYARYRTNVQAGAGLIAYSEASGFLVDLRGWNDLDYGTLHELAHQWWGNVYGARMQGRQVLNEGLAQYSTLMAYKEFGDPKQVRFLTAQLHDMYLRARSSETVKEQPVLLTEDQAYISYAKAPLALYALQELIGADRVNGALRNYYSRFEEMKPPFPTTRDLIDELRKVAGAEHQALITDLFEKIVLYDVSVVAADARAVDGGYEVTLKVAGTQFEAGGDGTQKEVPLETRFQVAAFPASDRKLRELEPLYLQYHLIRTGEQTITIRVPQKPSLVSIDPYHLMIDRARGNNEKRVSDAVRGR